MANISEEEMGKHAKEMRKMVKAYMDENDLEPLAEANFHALNYCNILIDEVYALMRKKEFKLALNYLILHNEMHSRPKELIEGLMMEVKIKE